MTGSFTHRVGLGLGGLLLVAATAGCAARGTSSPGATSGPVTDGSAGPGSAGSGSALVGAWTTSITKEDLNAAGVTDPGLQSENSGRFLWTFGMDGTWTSVQQSLTGSPLNTPVSRGTYVVNGASLVSTTMFPEQYRDDGLHYTWSLDGAGLKLDLLDPPDPMLPVIVETHPWTRVP
jgi:hypothetical protein